MMRKAPANSAGAFFVESWMAFLFMFLVRHEPPSEPFGGSTVPRAKLNKENKRYAERGTYRLKPPPPERRREGGNGGKACWTPCASRFVPLRERARMPNSAEEMEHLDGTGEKRKKGGPGIFP